MKTIIFLMFPIPSHFLSSYPLAKELRKKGYTIFYAGLLSFKESVVREGFEFIEFKYAEEYRISSFKTFIGILLQSLFDKNSIRLRYREFYGVEIISIKRLYEHVRPELIFIDEHLSSYYLGLFDFKDRIVFLNTKLSTRKKPGIPPLNSSYIPKKTILSKFICELLWLKHILGKEYLNLVIKIAFLGFDDSYFYNRVCMKKLGQRWRRFVTKKASFYQVIKDCPTLILAPLSLEYSQNKPLDTEYYLNIPISRNEDKYFTNDYLELKKKISHMLITERKIIYCGFGMINSIDYERVLLLMNKIIMAARVQKDWIVIISAGGVSYPIEPLPDNIYLFKYVPQLDILSYSHLMITHGGLTSIKEGLQYMVPLLVYPINIKGDTNGNSARVFNNGLGLRGSIIRDTPESLSKKISELLRNPTRKIKISEDKNDVLEMILSKYVA